MLSHSELTLLGARTRLKEIETEMVLLREILNGQPTSSSTRRVVVYPGIAKEVPTSAAIGGKVHWSKRPGNEAKRAAWLKRQAKARRNGR